jgi:GNAT superfamily N-acetyltransferase
MTYAVESKKDESISYMKILEYNDVDPSQVLHLTMLALDFPFTPEHAARIRRTDPRPFPCLTVNAVEDDAVLGQVGVFRLPMISTNGREDVGGVWAVSTHPAYSGRGVASALLEEAHTRMREAGLRFSTLGTDRYRIAYKLYQLHGYEDMHVHAIALAKWETAHQPTRLWAERVQPEGQEGYEFVEKLFTDIAQEYLGFAWRHNPFARLQLVDLPDIWIVQENGHPIGYAFVNADQSMLKISNLTLKLGADAAEAVSAITAELKSTYVQVKITRPAEIASLRRTGYQVAHPTWDAFLIKPLVPEVTVDDARHLFGIGTDRFLISWLDVT